MFTLKFVTVTDYKDSKIHECKFENGGKIVQKLTVIGDCEANRTGTTVTFKPDEKIFRAIQKNKAGNNRGRIQGGGEASLQAGAVRQFGGE